MPPKKENHEQVCKNLRFEVELLKDAYFQLEKVKKAAQKDRRELNSILEAAPVGIGIVGQGRKIIKVNERVLGMLDMVREEVEGKNAQFLYPSKEEYERVGREKYGQIRERGIGSVETKWVKADGTVIDVLLSSAVIDPLDSEKGVTFTAMDISERKQALQRFQKAAEVTADLIYEWHIDSDKLEWFGDIDGVLGYPQGTVPHTIKGWLGLVHPDDAKKLKAAVELHRTSTKPIKEEYRVRHQNGQWLYWTDSGIPIVEGGQPVRWIGACSNVTDQKKAELALKKSEVRYRNLVTNMPDALYVHDLKGKILDVNEGAVRMLGYSQEELLQLTLAKLNTPKFAKLIQPRVKKLLEKGELKFESEHIRKDGSIVPVSVSARLISQDQVGLVQSVVSDISGRKHRDLKLKQLREELQGMFDNIDDGIAIADLNGVVTRVNRRALAMAGGLKEEDLVGKRFYELDIFPPETISKLIPAFQATLSGKKTSPYEIEMNVLVDGQRSVLEVNGAPLMSDGKIAGVVVVFRDIQERKAAERRERELDVLKSRFITTLTHISRTPLNEIRWNLETMLSGEFGQLSNEQKVFIRKALDSESTLLRLIGDMDMALKIERGTLTLEKASVSVPSLAKSVVAAMKQSCDLKGVSCSYIPAEKQPPPINIDPEKIRGVLESLFENALRYTERGGSVKVRVRLMAKKVRVSVEDTGIGIPEAEQQNLFTRFFRASNAQYTHPEGVGLGLYLARAVVEKHRGSISFKSVEGQGSKFWFDLPIK